MPLAETEGLVVHRRYILRDPLCHQGKELCAEVRSMYNVRDDRKESGLSFFEILIVEEPEPCSCTIGGGLCLLVWEMRVKAGSY